MCNNLLQFAHAWAWAREHGRSAFSLRFAYKYPYFKISKSKGYNFFSYLLAKSLAACRLIPVASVDSPCQLADAMRVVESHRNVMLQGWYVRFYDLFLKYRPEIIGMFSFLPEVEAVADATLAVAPAGDDSLRVGIHVRRGDYARWMDGRFLFSDSQMAEVCRSICNAYPDKKIHFFVCGNDPSLDRSLYLEMVRPVADVTSQSVEFHFVCGNPGEDLCLLSKCDLIAGPPSTFSLTAALYHDAPLYWIKDAEEPVTPHSFLKFETLFRNII